MPAGGASEDAQLEWALAQSLSPGNGGGGGGGEAAGGGGGEVDAEAALSEDEQLALALSMSLDGGTDAPPSDYSYASHPNQPAAGGEDTSSAGGGEVDSDAELARALAAQFEAEQLEEAAASPHAAPPLEPTGGGGGEGGGSGAAEGGVGGLRIGVVGVATAGRGAHHVYQLRITMGDSVGGSTAQRFSAFLDLLNRLSKEAVGAADRGSAAAGVIDNWKRQLTVEKRHTGKASRSEAVVNGRMALLQRMLNDIVCVPELAHSAALATFLAERAAA